MYNVLLVEDLKECQLVVTRALSNADINLHILTNLTEAINYLKSDSVRNLNLVLLDLGLPDGEGLSFLEAVRTTFGDKVPVILLTSHADLDAKVTAFNLGADDYLVKPISGVELRARVEMRLKKAMIHQGLQSVLTKGSLVLDVSLMRASINDVTGSKPIALTAKEFKILAYLAQNEGKVFTRQDLMKTIWGESVHVLERTVDSHIFGLRKKLAKHAEYVECIPNIGYRFVVPANLSASKKVS